jgi:hypothetical protein
LDPRDLDLRLTDAKGREHRTAFLTTNSVARGVRELEAADLLWLSGPSQGAFPAALPWAALAQASRPLNRRQWTGWAQFSLPERLAAPARLTLSRFERLRTELPFEFRDLPLP